MHAWPVLDADQRTVAGIQVTDDLHAYSFSPSIRLISSAVRSKSKIA
jgi:hypothetical protein